MACLPHCWKTCRDLIGQRYLLELSAVRYGTGEAELDETGAVQEREKGVNIPVRLWREELGGAEAGTEGRVAGQARPGERRCFEKCGLSRLYDI
jgi:hypothetical protein